MIKKFLKRFTLHWNNKQHNGKNIWHNGFQTVRHQAKEDNDH
jgi:hypothetical protein